MAAELSQALFTAQTPSDLMATAAVAVGWLAPGATIGTALARRMHAGVPGAVAIAFAVSCALATVVMSVGGAAGATLGTGIVLYLAGAAALTLAGLRMAVGAPPLRADAAGTALAAGAAFFALFERPWMKVTVDAFYHAAAARSLIMRDALVVTDPFHGTAVTTPDPSSGVLHTMMAMVARAGGIDAAALMSGTTVIGALVLAAAFYVLAKRVSGSPAAAGVATAAYLVANQYLDFRAMGYPNRISLALVFLAMAAAIDLAERPSWHAGAVALSASGATLAMHVGSAEYLLVALAAIGAAAWLPALLDRWRDHRREAPLPWAPAALVAASVLLAVPLLLPKLGLVGASSVVDGGSSAGRTALVALGPFVVADPSRLFDGGTAALAMTGVLAFMACGWAVVRRDRVAATVSGLLLLPVLLLVTPPFTTLAVRFSYYNVVRLAALMGPLLFVGIAWALGRPAARGGRVQAVIVAVAALAVAGYTGVPFLQTVWSERASAARPGMSVSIWRNRASDIRELWGYDTIAAMQREFGCRYPMVAAEPVTGYFLAGLADVRLAAVAHAHSPVAVEIADGPRRRADMDALLLATATEEQRRVILDRYGAEYVIVWKSRRRELAAGRSMLDQPALFEPLVQSPRIILFRVRR